MDLLKEQSKKLRAQINDSFEILVDKMKSIAELRYSPKSFRKQEQRIDDIANMYRDDGPYNDMGNDMVREWQKFTGARPKIISNVTPQPNLMSTPVRPKFVTRGVQTPPLTRTPDDSLDLDWDGGMDILKFQDGGLRVPQEREPLNYLVSLIAGQALNGQEGYLIGGQGRPLLTSLMVPLKVPLQPPHYEDDLIAENVSHEQG